VNTVLTFLNANRKRLDLDRYSAGRRLSTLMVTPRFRASRHVVFLVFAGARREPILVAKLPRLPGGRWGIEREAANLRAAGVLLKEAGSIPRVVACEPYRGHPVLVETALAGRPMGPDTVRRKPAHCCRTMIDWLAKMRGPDDLSETENSLHGGWVPRASCPCTGETPVAPDCASISTSHLTAHRDDERFWRLIERPLSEFDSAFPLSADEGRLLEDTRRAVSALDGGNLPSVFEHGDLSHPNVMILRDGGAGVIDWELAEPRGLPAMDLFFFLTYAAFALNRAGTNGEYLRAFHAAFFERSAWARPFVSAYARRLQLPPETLTPLFVACWARRAIGLVARLDEAEEAGKPIGRNTAQWLRANRYYGLWRHTLSHLDELSWNTCPSTGKRGP